MNEDVFLPVWLCEQSDPSSSQRYAGLGEKVYLELPPVPENW